MRGYLLRRLALLPALLFGTALGVDALEAALPGDPAELILAARRGGEPPSPEEVAAFRRAHGLEAPRGVRFLRWLGALCQGDLGRSLRTGRPVAAELAEGLLRTARLTLPAAFLTVALSLALALGSHAPRLGLPVRALVVLLAATPVFLLGLLFLWGLALRLRLLPAVGDEGLSHLVLPALTLGLSGAALPARVLAASLGQELRRPYVRAARARGLTRGQALRRHALPNALLPWVTLLGLRLRGLLGGAVLVEALFGYRGAGAYLLEAVRLRDLPALRGTLFVLLALAILVTTATDLLCALLDPRVRPGGRVA